MNKTIADKVQNLMNLREIIQTYEPEARIVKDSRFPNQPAASVPS